ncbi:sugar ABC transporter ATP-binding protein [Clostridium autoethanogenum]|uniref:Autoinducer 2 import ATP-binding protein LsrA n=1 Tax=Clostridium autoethanogenum DSM 10061 TaxID=1341692 RepID=A0ABM5P035_9CLOT|nr:sugar ABC transporter ATP-binding protein [Clostridium autoethanogenum]AGY78201.1 sugar ABC transporter ATP-binding protein [Clostridium autoethanogenum DSM 10061]ALU38333.1 Monosaccharide-transporting ATPase [Clostridium autoethanogenum DSM 10061]OVY51096.1 Autoinducer 2 import ATP-binding protein LsrA [Clostridium autoethanogenum]
MEENISKNSEINTDNTLLSVRNIHKSFAKNKVLKGINLDVSAGEVLALIGGNGAGKSTLMKIIMCIYQQDIGDIYVGGKKVLNSKPLDAMKLGMYLVPQEPMLFPNMSVEENILIGFNESSKELDKRLRNLLEQIGWNLDLNRKAMTLSIAEQQLVELLRGLLRNAKLLILDEPTSALTFDEVESLFKIIEDLKKKNIGIIYITHRLAEVFTIATHVAIMRDGIITLNGEVKDFTREMLVQGLLPTDIEKKELNFNSTVPDYKNLKPIFSLKNFSGYGFKDVTFDVYPGEILGLAGVVGAGRTELATTIFGKDAVLGGKVYLEGTDITGMSTAQVMEKGISYIPEDRRQDGIFKIGDIRMNTTCGCLNHLSKFFINSKKERELTDKSISDFRIKVTGQDQLLGSLSGGNQQKVVIARTLLTHPKLIILDEPTRGIDASARGDVYSIMNKLKEKGFSFLLISSDMEEIIELSDRAVTMFQGRINHIFNKADINQNNLMSAAFGVYEEEKEGV